MMNKKNKIFLIISSLSFLSIIFFILLKSQTSSTSSSFNISKIGTVSDETSQVYDLSNLNVAVGTSDNVFVAKVLKIEGIYMQKNADGSDGTNPATMYRLKIIKNIKGILSTSKPVLLYKNGGQLSNGNTFISEGDILPEVGSYCIFTAGVEGGAPQGVTPAVPDGSLFSAGENSTVLLDKEETKALKSTKINDFQSAFANQQESNNQKRYSFKDSAVYLTNN